MAVGTATSLPPLWRGQAAARHSHAPRLAAVAPLRAAVAPLRATYWNFEVQVTALTEELQREPAEVLVLTGPASCGKSALLKQVVKRLRAAPCPPLVVSIDCRAGSYTTPEAFARALQLKAVEATWGARLPGALQSFVPFVVNLLAALDVKANAAGAGGINFSFALPRLVQRLLPIEDVLDIWQRALSDSPARVPAVFIVDEANRLRNWTGAPEQLANLLAFFARVSKQERRAHVVLATSDGAFTAWLGAQPGAPPLLSPLFFSTLYLAELSEPEARRFFTEHATAHASAAAAALDDACWARVFEVCGGNPGTLLRVASHVRDDAPDGWRLGVRRVLAGAEATVLRGLSSGAHTADASPAHYAAVALALLREQNHALDAATLRELVGAPALAALVGAYLLGLQGAEPLGVPEPIATAEEVALLSRYRPFSAGEVCVWRRMQAKLEAAAKHMPPPAL